MIMTVMIKCSLYQHLAGILVTGGASGPGWPNPSQSVEFWSAADPEQGSCVLKDFPRRVYSPTVNLVSGHLVACYGESCDVYRGGSWQHLQKTTVFRQYHSSAATDNAVLLIGGDYSNTTEWIPVDGSPAQEGPFTTRHGWGHCTIQISDDIIVLTGGSYTEDIVAQYQLSDGTKTALTSMGQPRYEHACGAYKDTDDQQVRNKAL